jgi:predicted DNA-binding transcriptional regulator YafY
VKSMTDFGRSAQVIRMLRLAVMLRYRAATVEELAVAMNVTTRTVRRDLIALEAVPFPLEQVRQEDGRLCWRVTGPSPLTDGGR